MRMILSLLAAACGSALFAQTLPSLPPGGAGTFDFKTPGTGTLVLAGEAPKPAAGSVEEAIALALRQHPDVKLAEARRMAADAQLDQARLAVTQRITASFAKIQAAKLALAAAEKDHARVTTASKEGRAGVQELDAAGAALLKAKGEVDAAVAELETAKGGAAKALQGTVTLGSGTLNITGATTLTNLTGTNTYTIAGSDRPPSTSTPSATRSDVELVFNTRGTRETIAVNFGPVGDTLRTLIDKKITIDQPASPPNTVFDALMKEAGESGIMVRFPRLPARGADGPKVGPMKGEQTFHAWVQLIMDDLSADKGANAWFNQAPLDVYVRNYGLLVTPTQTAPPGAVTLAQFAEWVHAEKAASAFKAESKSPEPKR